MHLIALARATSDACPDGNTITDVVITLGSIFLTVVAPVFIVFYFRRRRNDGSPGDQMAADDLRARASRLEDRIAFLERSLDTEVPGWRARI